MDIKKNIKQRNESLKRDIMSQFWNNLENLLRMLEISNADELCFYRSAERSTARLWQARRCLVYMISNLDDVMNLDDEENENDKND